MSKTKVDPSLAHSRRVKVLATRPVIRAVVRRIVHRFPSLWTRVSGSYAGPVDLVMEGARFRYVLGPSDTIGDILYWRGERRWEGEVIPVFCRLAKHAQGTLLDIGANFGIYSVLACAVNPQIRVRAWEPVPFIHAGLELNAAESGFASRIECRRAALADRSGTATFFLHPDASMGGFADRSRDGRSIEVQVESADDVMPQDVRVGLVKIDVEGYEYDALMGMRRILETQGPPIIFECLNQHAWPPIVGLLSTYGYGIAALTRQGPRAVTDFQRGVTNYLAEVPATVSPASPARPPSG